MQVLIVQSQVALGEIWRRHLERQGARVALARTADDALSLLDHETFHVIVLDLVLEDGNALTVADIASFRQPQASVIFVTDTTFFSDGSIFNHSANARMLLPKQTPPEELAAVVSHYSKRITHADGAHQSPFGG